MEPVNACFRMMTWTRGRDASGLEGDELERTPSRLKMRIGDVKSDGG